MDGLAAGAATVVAAAVIALATVGQQPAAVVLGAALAGACLGFLVYNRRPASIFMGDAGSLFLGFMLAVVTIDVNPALRPPASFAVPVMLLALPVLDTTTVTLARLRRGRRVSQGACDHLSHRLVALGLSPGIAVWALVMVEAASALLAVLAGRRVLPLGVAMAGVAVLVGAVSAVTARAQVYAEPIIGILKRVAPGGNENGLGWLRDQPDQAERDAQINSEASL
jgi:UDP-GlcNAc:undecaprenyl-phosphate GlcNAc-1-phosphate transferase